MGGPKLIVSSGCLQRHGTPRGGRVGRSDASAVRPVERNLLNFINSVYRKIALPGHRRGIGRPPRPPTPRSTTKYRQYIEVSTDPLSIGSIYSILSDTLIKLGLSIEDDDEPDDVEELPPLEEDGDEGSKMEEVD